MVSCDSRPSHSPICNTWADKGRTLQTERRISLYYLHTPMVTRPVNFSLGLFLGQLCLWKSSTLNTTRTNDVHIYCALRKTAVWTVFPLRHCWNSLAATGVNLVLSDTYLFSADSSSGTPMVTSRWDLSLLNKKISENQKMHHDLGICWKMSPKVRDFMLVSNESRKTECLFACIFMCNYQMWLP